MDDSLSHTGAVRTLPKEVLLAEQHADGAIPYAEFAHMFIRTVGYYPDPKVTLTFGGFKSFLLYPDPLPVGFVAEVAGWPITRATSRCTTHAEVIAARAKEQHRVSSILRCVLGNPFRPAALAVSWLAWNDGAIRKMAQFIYDDRAFDRLPLLADALEDAGCTDAAILSHCREPGEHVRGCWVVDLLLGKS